MRVEVALPEIDRETVTFHWTQSEPNDVQHQNSFFFRYDGVDLTRFSTPFFYDLFLGLQLRIFAAYAQPVELVFPIAISPAMISFWSSYHETDLVTISPVADESTYSPWHSEPPTTPNPAPIGVFFGGGKDSMALSCLFAEARGAGNVVLFQLTHPKLRVKGELERVTNRQAELMLQPVRDLLGVETQHAETNYLSNLRLGPPSKRSRPHLELYTVGLLPAMLARGVSFCSSAVERTAYRNRSNNDGSRFYHYRKSRPEVLAAQSRYYQRVLGIPLEVANINYIFSSLMSMRLLAERYPAALHEIIMCSGAPQGERWCYHCLKCVEYVFYTLRCGVVDPRFNYDFFFTQSRYVLQLMTYAESGTELQANGNARWESWVSVDGHFAGFCHAIAHLNPSILTGRLGSPALSNLLIIKAMFGNALYPNVEMLAWDSVKKLGEIGNGIVREIATIAGEQLPVVDDLPRPIVVGNSEWFFDYDHRMPLWGGLTAFES